MHVTITNQDADGLPVWSQEGAGWLVLLANGQTHTVSDASSLVEIGERPAPLLRDTHRHRLIADEVDAAIDTWKGPALAPHVGQEPRVVVNVRLLNDGATTLDVVLGQAPATTYQVAPGELWQRDAVDYVRLSTA